MHAAQSDLGQPDPVVMVVSSLLDTGRALARTGRCCCEMHESHDSDGALSVALIGELDIASAETLSRRLRELNEAGWPVRLDLSHLEFVDCKGLDAIVIALLDARQVGWQLEVDRQVSRSVERLICIADAMDLFWPIEAVDQSNVLAPFGSGPLRYVATTTVRPTPF